LHETFTCISLEIVPDILLKDKSIFSHIFLLKLSGIVPVNSLYDMEKSTSEKAISTSLGNDPVIPLPERCKVFKAGSANRQSISERLLDIPCVRMYESDSDVRGRRHDLSELIPSRATVIRRVELQT
jgi:hypothetical protein